MQETLSKFKQCILGIKEVHVSVCNKLFPKETWCFFGYFCEYGFFLVLTMLWLIINDSPYINEELYVNQIAYVESKMRRKKARKRGEEIHLIMTFQNRMFSICLVHIDLVSSTTRQLMKWCNVINTQCSVVKKVTYLYPENSMSKIDYRKCSLFPKHFLVGCFTYSLFSEKMLSLMNILCTTCLWNHCCFK